MKSTTLTKPESKPIPSLRDAEAAHAQADAEVARLRELCSGQVATRVSRTTRQGFINARGVGEQRDVTEAVWETRAVDRLDRMRAQQALPGAEAARLEAAAQLEGARQRAAVAARTAREALEAEGLALLRRELPRLVREQRRVQAEWQALQARGAALDQRLGMERFAPAGWPFVMGPGAQLDAFVAYCRAAYGIALDD